MAAAISTGTETKLVPGRPFQPGVSGNPSGRPALPAEVKAKLHELGPKALVRLAELMDSDNEQVAVRACESILDRAYGKAVQRHEFEIDDAREAARRMARELGLDEDAAVREAEAITRGE